jgi:L-alanine-DL-glutamate epimerase-like enolase superfamily enzyme
MDLQLERWPLLEPFSISGHTFEELSILVVTLRKDGCAGRGEAAGVYYREDVPASMLATLEQLRPVIEAGISRAKLQMLLPPSGARNAIDCASWDLLAKLSDTPAWRLAGFKSEPQPVCTTFTCGAASPEAMAAKAQSYKDARAIKLKLMGHDIDVERVRAVRACLPDVWLGVDANQGFTRPFLERLMPVLLEQRVALIEQPFAVGEEHLLQGFASPIPIAADESVQNASDVPAMVGRFNVINIKLDKCGGLTEALQMCRVARESGLQVMVGNMIGTSLAMAPAFLVAQLCSVVDLDGPTLLRSDRSVRVQYSEGLVSCPQALWG